MESIRGVPIPHLWQIFPPSAGHILGLFSGGLAFDIGAHVGEATAELAQRFIKVIACEPNPQSFTHLLMNLPSNVLAVNAAVSDVVGFVDLEARERQLGDGQYTTSDGEPEPFPNDVDPWGEFIGTVRCDATTIDELTELHGRPNFIKIDVEGHEFHVITGAKRTLKFHPALYIEIHHRNLGIRIRDTLEEFDYRLEIIRHDNYLPDSWGYKNHFFMVGT